MTHHLLQGLFSGSMGAADVQQGWGVAVSPTHLAVTLPSRVIAVYAFPVSLVQLHHAQSHAAHHFAVRSTKRTSHVILVHQSVNQPHEAVGILR